jgi:hypothetical protein
VIVEVESKEMAKMRSGNFTHDQVCNTAEGVRQAEVAAAGSQAAVRTAELKYYRAVRDSCRSNNAGSGIEQANAALRDLGVWT